MIIIYWHICKEFFEIVTFILRISIQKKLNLLVIRIKQVDDDDDDDIGDAIIQQ